MQDTSAQIFVQEGTDRVPAECTLASVLTTAEFVETQHPGFDHYVIYYGNASNVLCGGYAPMEGGELGTLSRPGKVSWFNASPTCEVFVRGLSANFGHLAASLRCGDSPFLDDPRNGCAEYTFDDHDPTGQYMVLPGNMSILTPCYHTNAWQKVARGWLDRCNGVRVRVNGTYHLLPLESSCDGAQVLQVPMTRERTFDARTTDGTTRTERLRFYYLELRTKSGFDAALQDTPVVLVRVADDFNAAGEPPQRTWLLDMVPPKGPDENPYLGDWDGLHAGESFTDPAGGVLFKVQAISAERATIEITIPNGAGASTCLDGTALAPPGPGGCSTGGAGGMGGTSGTGGDGGASGTSDGGGIDSTSGTNGTSGAGGIAGASDAGPTAGNGGAPGSGGTAGMADGASASGTSGTASDPGLLAQRGVPAENDGGCGCRTTSTDDDYRRGALLALALALVFRLRRSQGCRSIPSSAQQRKTN